jgi:PKD repeat protein
MKKLLQLIVLVILNLTVSSATAQTKVRLATGVSSQCLTGTFVAEGTLLADSCAQLKWSITGNGTTSYAYGTKATYTFPAAGTYTVCAKLLNTCAKFDTMVCKTITVVSCDCKLTTEFSFSNDCKKVKFKASSNQTGTTYSWNFGDKTTGTGVDPTHSYLSEGVYKVCVTATWTDSTGKKCTATFCKEIKVSCGTPCDLKGDFSFVSSGAKFRFKASSNTGYTYSWDFGDGKTGKGIDPYHEYAKAGTYTVCVTITDKTGKCKIKICKTITVGNPCGIIGGMTWKKTNDSTYKFFASSNTGTGTTYFWNWGDGTTSTGKDATHVYKKSGTYEVCVKIYNSYKKCFVYICRKVEVVIPTSGAKCTWDKTAIKVGYSNDCNKYTFEMTYFQDSCIKYQLSVYNMKTGVITALTPGRLGTYTFNDTGKFAIIAKYSNVCKGCDTQTYSIFNVTCKPAPAKCNWAAAGASLGYNNKSACNTYFFEGKNMNTSTSNCVKYTIGIGQTGATNTYYYSRTATHTFTKNGTYNVCIKYYDSCKSCDTMICSTITVNCCNAKASFTVDSVSATGKMYVKNTSTGAKSYVWNFGDSTTNSKDKTPIHQFATSGTYVVCLTAYDSLGTCSSVYCYTVKVLRTRGKSNTQTLQGGTYPNPADLGFYLDLTTGTKYTVYNNLGQVITSGKGDKPQFIGTANWAEGNYRVVLINAEGTQTISTVVAH